MKCLKPLRWGRVCRGVWLLDMYSRLRVNQTHWSAVLLKVHLKVH